MRCAPVFLVFIVFQGSQYSNAAPGLTTETGNQGNADEMLDASINASELQNLQLGLLSNLLQQLDDANSKGIEGRSFSPLGEPLFPLLDALPDLLKNSGPFVEIPESPNEKSKIPASQLDSVPFPIRIPLLSDQSLFDMAPLNFPKKDKLPEINKMTNINMKTVEFPKVDRLESIKTELRVIPIGEKENDRKETILITEYKFAKPENEEPAIAKNPSAITPNKNDMMYFNPYPFYDSMPVHQPPYYHPSFIPTIPHFPAPFLPPRKPPTKKNKKKPGSKKPNRENIKGSETTVKPEVQNESITADLMSAVNKGTVGKTKEIDVKNSIDNQQVENRLTAIKSEDNMDDKNGETRKLTPENNREVIATIPNPEVDLYNLNSDSVMPGPALNQASNEDINAPKESLSNKDSLIWFVPIPSNGVVKNPPLNVPKDNQGSKPRNIIQASVTKYPAWFILNPQEERVKRELDKDESMAAEYKAPIQNPYHLKPVFAVPVMTDTAMQG